MELKPKKPIKDDRGSFTEVFKLPNDGQVSYFIINPEESRGNHYHMRKTEHFLVMYGSATITVRNRETDDIMKAEVSGFKPIAIKISPNHTHALTAGKEGCIVLVWADEVFNKDDPDTYGEEI